ncbi:MAG: FAD-dependent oxidoreductase [Bifidobacteriaceae bacterium]|jgi:electron transfer flavoprotein-quinone oxidoreductase|nr:FAD-dependent oxidoreductase [Bifidobacteriaceae bacterium]
MDFDVIVVGAGIAGCVTAYQLASGGHSVLLVERGAEPGAKNLSGGVLYCRVMEKVFPGFVDKAPVERRITRNYLGFLNQDSLVGIDYHDQRLGQPVNAVSVLRAKLDAWLAEQCEGAGAVVMPGIKVDSLLSENGQYRGIKAGDDELTANVVVLADGVNSFLAREAGLRGKEPLKHLAVGVKSVIGLPAGVIEDRFGVAPGEGAAYAIVGDCTAGVGGGGFLYTNQESLSIGVVLRLDDLVAKGLGSVELHDRFVQHPGIAPLLKDGELLEYGCHLVAEGGQAMVHDLARPGLVVVGDAAGLTLNTGLTVRGMDLAAASGIAAASAIEDALADKHFSQAAMDGYVARLNQSFAGKDMATYAKAPAFMENPRLFNDYGPLLANILRGFYNLDTTPREHALPVVRGALKASGLGLVRLARDGLAGVRAL